MITAGGPSTFNHQCPLRRRLALIGRMLFDPILDRLLAGFDRRLHASSHLLAEVRDLIAKVAQSLADVLTRLDSRLWRQEQSSHGADEYADANSSQHTEHYAL